MFGGGQRYAVGVVLALVCLSAFGAGGALIQSTTATEATAQTSDADTNVAFTYLDGGEVTLVTESGERHHLGVTAETVGAAKDINGDGYVEIPYVKSNNELYITNRNGTTTQLASNAALAKVAIGNLSGGEDRVFYIDTDASLNAVTVGGDITQIVNPSDTLKAVAGIADLTGDGRREAVYTGGSTVRYYNTTDETIYSSGIGSSGKAIGAPRSFNGDVRVPIVDGSQNIDLVDAPNGAETSISLGNAEKAPVAGVNWTGSATLEVLYLKGNTVKYATLDGDTGTVASITNADINAGVAWAADADAPLALSNFTLTNRSGTLQVSFDSNSDLASLDVTIEGPDGTSLALDAFNETSTDGSYTYVGNYTPTADGDYNATLNSATAVDGDTTTPQYTDTATIDTRFNVTDLNATATGRNITVSFNATESLSGVTVEITGPETDTLDLSSFTKTSSTAPYAYTGTYNATAIGEYNVTLTQATSTDGQVDDENLTDTAITDEPLDVSNFTLTNETDGIHVAFNASEQLDETTVSIDGPTDTTLDYNDFTETATGDAFAYEATYDTTTVGTYNGTLERAASTDGDVVTPNLSSQATIGNPFDVTNLTATARNGDLDISFDATHTLDTVTVAITGAETDTLTRDAFSTNDSSPTYTYTGRYSANTTGTYNVTLTDATATDGQTHEENLTGTATLHPLLANASLADTTDQNAIVNESDRITITASVSEAADAVTADAAAFGAGTVSLNAVDETTYRETVDVAVSNVTEPRRVDVTVTGASGREASDTTNTLLVDTEPPTVDAGTNQTVDAGTNVSFSPAQATDSTTRIVAYRWRIGGTNYRGETITTTFDDPGNYTVRLAVTDAAGNVGTDGFTITVNETDPQTTTTTTTTTSTTTSPSSGGGSNSSNSDDSYNSGDSSDSSDGGGFVNQPPTTTTDSTQTTSPPTRTATERSMGGSAPQTTMEPSTTSTTTDSTVTETESAIAPRHNVEMPFGNLFGVTASTTVLAVAAAMVLVGRRRTNR